jgi:hypothetical protein
MVCPGNLLVQPSYTNSPIELKQIEYNNIPRNFTCLLRAAKFAVLLWEGEGLMRNVLAQVTQ